MNAHLANTLIIVQCGRTQTIFELPDAPVIGEVPVSEKKAGFYHVCLGHAFEVSVFLGGGGEGKTNLMLVHFLSG